MITLKNCNYVHIIVLRYNVYLLKHRHASVWKVQHKGVCQETNTAWGEAKCCICLKTPHECCIFHTDKQGGALSDILYFQLDSRFLMEVTTELVVEISEAIGLYHMDSLKDACRTADYAMYIWCSPSLILTGLASFLCRSQMGWIIIMMFLAS